VGSVIDYMAGLPPGLLLTLVFLLPAAEASFLLGMLIPGETAVLLGGVVAQQGRLSLTLVMVAAVAGAILGDQIGFVLGRRYGPAVVARTPNFLVSPAAVDRALDVIRRRGSAAVLLGRWAATLRALVPGVAGMSGMKRRPFTIANAIGGSTWAVAVAVAGFVAGASYQKVADQFGRAGEILSVVVVVAIVVVLTVRHFRRPPVA
jgi:undecaprenyl-diphosphatase